MPGASFSTLLERLIPQAGADGGRPKVLVTYASGVLATAISRRLALCADVDLKHVRDTPRRLPARPSYDAVVICPYLTDAESQRIHAAVAASHAPPVVVDIRESIGHVHADVHDWGDARRSAALRPVVEALTG